MNNVGVLNDDLVVTAEGREASFTSNLLSHYQLTEALIAKGALGRGAVVVNVTSGGGYNVPLSTAMRRNEAAASTRLSVATWCCRKVSSTKRAT